MEAQIRRVGVALVVMLLMVFVQLNYVQVFAARRIAGNNANVLSLIREYGVKRGDIITFDGKVVATSRATNGKFKYLRTYPGGELYGHLTGYYSITYGTDRLERSYQDQLLGNGGVLSMQDIEDRFLGEADQGDDIRMTIDSQLQQAASDALGDNSGAVVAMDPRTGAIKAMVSKPDFDPSPLASFSSSSARRYWNSLDPASPESPLINRATSQSYPPGSTMKVVTAGAALDSGQYTSESTFPDPLELDLPLSTETLTNFSKQTCAGGGEIGLFDALRISCDTTFALLGLDIPDEILSMAEAFGFNHPIPFDVRTAASVFPDVPDDEAPLRAYTAIGQSDTRATPLQMALVAATVANDGVEPAPYLVQEVIDPSGGIVSRTSPESLSEPMTADTAAELTQMMEAVVQSGTGVTAQIPGVAVAGKTGTAQTGVEGENPHTWFISFAPADDPRIAVAVIVEHGGTFGSEATGGAVAAPIAKIVMEEARAKPGMVEGIELLGRYRLESKLATGGMGTVFVAEDKRLGRKVAVKLLKEDLAHDAQFVERFRREARAAAGLSHANIARVFDYGEDKGRDFIVMELLEGRDLSRVLKDEAPLSVERTAHIGIQICDALEHAHSAGVVHRDIKPANIMVNARDFVKVTDFGIARAVGDTAMTMTGLVLGTAQYISPEQANGAPVGPSSDIYSLGVMLYEMLTGVLPFKGDSALAIAMRHVSDDVPPPSVVTPSAAPLDQATANATAKDPQSRPDAPGLASALSAALASSTETTDAAATGVLVPATTLPDMSIAGPAESPPGLPAQHGWVRDRLSRAPLAVVVLLCLVVAAAAVIMFATADKGERTPEDRRARRLAAAPTEQKAPARATPSSSSDGVVIPEGIVGQPAKEAASLLRSFGVNPDSLFVDSEKETAGLVLSTEPAPGSMVSGGDTVTVYVGSGNTEDVDRSDHGPGNSDSKRPGHAKGRKEH